MKSWTRMSKAVAVAVCVLSAAACSRGAAAQQAGAQQPSTAQAPPSAQQQAPAAATQPGAMSATLVTLPATVKKVDKVNGLVTLEGPRGAMFDVKAGPGVDTNKLHAGDAVQASYYEEAAVSINKASTGAPRMTTRAVQRGGVTAMQSTVTARIVSVDAPKNTVVIRGPQGGDHTLKVEDPNLQARLAEMKPGEAFDITYTQAVAVSIEPRKK